MVHYYTPNDLGIVKLFLVCLTHFLVVTKEERWNTTIKQNVTYITLKSPDDKHRYLSICMWGPYTNLPLFILGRRPAEGGTGCNVGDSWLTEVMGIANTAGYHWCIVGNISSMVKTENKKKEGLNVNVIRAVLATYNPIILLFLGNKSSDVEDLPEIENILSIHETYHLGDLTVNGHTRMLRGVALKNRTTDDWKRIYY